MTSWETNHIKLLITHASRLFGDNEEFDTARIIKVMKRIFGIEFPSQTIRTLLKGMDFSRRNLNEEETEKWRRKYGSQPKIVYKKHLGSDPEKYPRGITQVRIIKRPHPQDRANNNDEECGLCPEQEECWQQNMGCLRNPDISSIDTRKVWKLEEFEE